MLGQLHFLDAMYERYRSDPESVDSSWRCFFEGMELGRQEHGGGSLEPKVMALIHAYRVHGHLAVHLDPLGKRPQEPRVLDPLTWGLGGTEMIVPTCGFLKKGEAALGELVESLKSAYCLGVGIEYMGISPEIEKYVQERFEPHFQVRLPREEKVDILESLAQAELFEVFLHTKYVGQKRFSLEGGETLIPILRALIEKGVDLGLDHVFLGMAHRGRLNVLAHILGKSYTQIFREFEDYYDPGLFEGTGDVKYHKGFTGELKTKKGKKAQVFLTANPSHLESVDPVVEGQVRAFQERGKRAFPLLIHGDAALAGQGVIYETLQLQRLEGYGTQGSIHVVINNHIGFTTLPRDSRSTFYCTDIARAFGAPVLHVNAEDPESCVAAAVFAMELRHTFQCDVFIDLNCYRKYGHNESDEPAFTQPLIYQTVKAKKTIRTLYEERLIQEGVLTQPQVEGKEMLFKQQLHTALESITSVAPSTQGEKKKESEVVLDEISKEKWFFLVERCTCVPEGFQIHPKVAKLMIDRLGNDQVDWGTAEMLAMACLVDEGVHVRLSGQDVRRGTFSHRHAAWVDQKTQETYVPLAHIREGQAPFEVFNSPLSEYAVLGFEFGYSISYPKSLVIWEAQFGDFSNGAQIIIDQYIAASEQKWGVQSSLMLMLPHGYEGQGPEHSSARMERFLQLCGHDNMSVVNVTTPVQLFYVMRRQALAQRPLILFTPKALLRHPMVVSSKELFYKGRFEEVIFDPHPPKKANKLVLCSGKIYYDLLREREQRKCEDVALVRIEELYPFPKEHVHKALYMYGNIGDVFWVQEEHANMGAWNYVRPHLQEIFLKVRYIGRECSASPAVGSHAAHNKQHLAIMDEVFS